MWFRYSFTLVVLAMTTLTPAGAQNVEDWHSLRTDHFLLAGDASNGAMRRVAERLEEFRSSVVALLPVLMPEFVESEEPDTTVVVFRNDRAFDPFKPSDRDNISGYFSPGSYRNYIALTGGRDLEQTIYHEYIHQITRDTPQWRLWMREGMAELYATIEVLDRGKTIRAGQVIEAHLFELSERSIPLETLFAEEPGLSDSTRITFYAESWALLHYLMFGNPELGAQVSTFNVMLASGNDIATSVRASFGMDIATLERELLLYVRNSLTFRATDYSLARPLADFEAGDTQEISEAEADFQLGDLLSHIGRFEEARTHLERAIQSRPDYAPALTALYLLAEEEGKAEEAAAYLDRAVAAPDAGYLPRLLRARDLLLNRPWEDIAEEAEAQLVQVIEMKPSLAEAYYWLGQSLVRRPESVGEAANVLREATLLDRENRRIGLAYAQALWLSGADDEAETVLSALYATTFDPALRNQIEDLQNRMQLRRATLGRAPDVGRLGEAGQTSQDTPRAPNSEAATNRPGTGEDLSEATAQLEGFLTDLLCADGLTVVLATENEIVEFQSAAPDRIQFMSYSPDVVGLVSCGRLDSPLRVRVVYRPAHEGLDDSLGEPVLIEFLPD